MATRAELRQDLKTICYEFKMLAATADRLAKRKYENDSATTNALLESFALHTRAILHFFYHDVRLPSGQLLFPGGKKKTDVVADDFFTTHSCIWRRRPKITTTLIRAKQRADKQIAHITHMRRPLNSPKARGKTWHFRRIVKHLSRAMSSFIESAPRLARKEAAKIRKALEYVENW